METKPLVSVVMPVFNERDYIDEIIRRVMKSPLDDKELIIVDDFSTDGTRAHLEQISRCAVLILVAQVADAVMCREHARCLP